MIHIHSFNKQRQRIQETIPPLLTVRGTTKCYVSVVPFFLFTWLHFSTVPRWAWLPSIYHQHTCFTSTPNTAALKPGSPHTSGSACCRISCWTWLHFLLFFFLPCTVFFRVGGWGLLSCSASTLVVFFLFLLFSHRPHFCSADSTQLVGFLCVPHVILNHLNLLFDFVPRGLHLTPKEHRERRPLTPLLVFPFVVRSTPAVWTLYWAVFICSQKPQRLARDDRFWVFSPVYRDKNTTVTRVMLCNGFCLRITGAFERWEYMRISPWKRFGAHSGAGKISQTSWVILCLGS